MADNITVNPGTESNRVNVATDEVDQIHYPIYKMAIGADGEAVLINSANPIPVQNVNQDTYQLSMLNEIMKQLQIMNMHLSVLSDIDIQKEEIQ